MKAIPANFLETNFENFCDNIVEEIKSMIDEKKNDFNFSFCPMRVLESTFDMDIADEYSQESIHFRIYKSGTCFILTVETQQGYIVVDDFDRRLMTLSNAEQVAKIVVQSITQES